MNPVVTFFYEYLNALKCGQGFLSVFPSLLFILCIGRVCYHFLLAGGRTPAYRRLTRDVLVQELIFVWMVNLALKIWLFIVYLIDTSLQSYWLQMEKLLPALNSDIDSGPDLTAFPVLIQFMMQPDTIKMTLCSTIAVLPLIMMNKIIQTRREPHGLAQFMVWLGAHRWDRTELGQAGYFMARPVAQAVPPAPIVVTTRHSTGSICFPGVTDSIDRLFISRAPGPRTPPARKQSLNLRLTKSTII